MLLQTYFVMVHQPEQLILLSLVVLHRILLLGQAQARLQQLQKI